MKRTAFGCVLTALLGATAVPAVAASRGTHLPPAIHLERHDARPARPARRRSAGALPRRASAPRGQRLAGQQHRVLPHVGHRSARRRRAVLDRLPLRRPRHDDRLDRRHLGHRRLAELRHLHLPGRRGRTATARTSSAPRSSIAGARVVLAGRLEHPRRARACRSRSGRSTATTRRRPAARPGPPAPGCDSPGIDTALMMSSRGARLIDGRDRQGPREAARHGRPGSAVVRRADPEVASSSPRGSWRIRLAAGLADAAGTGFAPAAGRAADPARGLQRDLPARRPGAKPTDNFWDDIGADQRAAHRRRRRVLPRRALVAARAPRTHAASRSRLGWSDRWYVSAVEARRRHRHRRRRRSTTAKPNYLGRVQPYARLRPEVVLANASGAADVPASLADAEPQPVRRDDAELHASSPARTATRSA